LSVRTGSDAKAPFEEFRRSSRRSGQQRPVVASFDLETAETDSLALTGSAPRIDAVGAGGNVSPHRVWGSSVSPPLTHLRPTAGAGACKARVASPPGRLDLTAYRRDNRPKGLGRHEHVRQRDEIGRWQGSARKRRRRAVLHRPRRGDQRRRRRQGTHSTSTAASTATSSATHSSRAGAEPSPATSSRTRRISPGWSTARSRPGW
jgi:predicted Fe-S protein YdhL (DUF1289 family)